MNEYVTDILLENAKSTLDEKLRSLRDEYRNKGVPTLLTESLNELILFVKIKKPKTHCFNIIKCFENNAFCAIRQTTSF